MTRCPITYKKLTLTKYSSKGLRSFSNKINGLKDIEIDFNNGSSYSSNQQTRECFARLQVEENSFIMGDENDRFIFVQDKTPDQHFICNRDLTMKLAAASGIKTVVHGLAYHQNGSMVFWYKRPQFYGRHKLLVIKTFSELLPADNGDIFKNLSNKLAHNCTFPALEKLKLLRLTIFSFLIGKESISVDDLTLIEKKGITGIAPHYHLVNSHIYQNANETNSITFLGKEINLANVETALTFSTELLGVNPKAFKQVLMELNTIYLKWLKIIEISFIKNPIKKEYLKLLRHRRKLFFKF